jgi:hypothetical protein
MTVTGPDGGQIPPDWSCYAPDAAFLIHPLPQPAIADAGEDADDAGLDAAADTGVDAADSAPPVDSSAPVDSSTDSATAADAGQDASYELHLTDFVSSVPPVGATVDIFWGPSTLTSVGWTGIVNADGIVYFAPPAGQQLLSYHVWNGPADAGQASEYWTGAPIVPPPGATPGNSLSTGSLSELLTSLLGSETPNAALATLVTGADDCQYRDVAGGQFQLVDSSGTPVATGTTQGSPRAFYLQNDLPAPQCQFTTNQGGRSVWSMINAPVTQPNSPGSYKLQFIGRMTASQATPVVIDEYAIETYAGSVSVHRASRINATPPN